MLVERHYIKGTKEIRCLCSTSRDLYNRCNFFMRQAWFGKQRLPDIGMLITAVKNEPCFKELHNTKTAKQTVWQVLTDWSNYKKATNAYFKDKSRFVRKPKPPHYKKQLAQVIFYNETIKRKPARLGELVPTNEVFRIKSDKAFKQVVITPKSFGYIVEVQYKPEPRIKPKRDKAKICCIDIGLNNLCTITQNQQRPILVNGRIVKSINQWYNKKHSKTASKKRYFRLENYFHHVSKFIVENCIEHKLGRIIIGKNDGWKTSINLGKRNNQNFCSVPYYLLFQKIGYKAEREGIDVVFTEEAYTSQSSFFDNDPLPEYRNGTIHAFSGKRKHRGLYVTRDDYAVNADVNGSLNIGRKVIPEFLGIGDRSLAARPIVVNPLKVFMPNWDKMEMVGA